MPRFAELCGDERYALNRSKQWLKMACYGQKPEWFERYKRTQSWPEALQMLESLSR
jgi:hypothetical protein